MAKLKGKDFLLKVGDGVTPTEGFTTVAALRASSIKSSNGAINNTTVDDGEWETIQDVSGIKKVTVSASGVATDDATLTGIKTDHWAGTLRNFKLYNSSGHFFSGAFKITSFEEQGEYSKEGTFSITLESSGAVSYT